MRSLHLHLRQKKMYWVCICFRALTLHTIDNAKNEEKMSNYNDVTQLTAYGTNSQKPKKN